MNVLVREDPATTYMSFIVIIFILNTKIGYKITSLQTRHSEKFRTGKFNFTKRFVGLMLKRNDLPRTYITYQKCHRSMFLKHTMQFCYNKR